MARINVALKQPAKYTHEGAVAAQISPLQALKRSVMSCFLWEDEFYEDGQKIADRIMEHALKVPIDDLIAVATEARTSGNLRHVPLLLLVALVKRAKEARPGQVAKAIYEVVQRADEMGELLALYWKFNPAPKGGKRPMVAASLRKGLAAAILRFDEYQLGKYDRDSAGVKIRDVIRLVHPRPSTDGRSALYKRAVTRTLETPDTWEVALSSGQGKKETFERLIKDGKLGYLALLRNLRNMAQDGTDPDLVREAIVARKNGAHRVLPFRFIAAARAAPQFEPALDQALLATVRSMEPFYGETIILVDVSGSMTHSLSGKSDLTRIDAAAALASIFPGVCRIATFDTSTREVPPRKGMAGVDAIRSATGGGTDIWQAIAWANRQKPYRIILITDEQTLPGTTLDGVWVSGRRPSSMEKPAGQFNYAINVASARNGVTYGSAWTAHVDGFSENVLRYIREVEQFARS